MGGCARRRRLLLSSTMLAAALTGYGRSAYGQQVCDPQGGQVFLCDGVSVETQDLTNQNNATVNTVAGFSVNTQGTSGNAISITGDGALSYTDPNGSSLRGYDISLLINSGGDDGGTPGSVLIDTNGTLIGGTYGILAGNSGTGAITITTTNGLVQGNGLDGIYAYNSIAGTDITITTGSVAGMRRGIALINVGSGTLAVTANGYVVGTNQQGIYAKNYGDDLTVITAVGTTVNGYTHGIEAQSYGSGAATITANGDVTGTTNDGIYARHFGMGDLTLTTGAGTTIAGGTRGIRAFNYGSGALIVTANGDVEGTIGTGTYARQNNAAAIGDLSIMTQSVTGGYRGIDARNFGTGTLEIIVNGDVGDPMGIVPSNTGIFALNSNANSTDLSIISQGVTGGTFGIFANNFGTGALEIVANGDVAGTGVNSVGIYAHQNNAAATGPLSITTYGMVTGVSRGIDARNDGAGALTIVANGDVTSDAGTGILADSNGNGLDLSVGAGSTVHGYFNAITANNAAGLLKIDVKGEVDSDLGYGVSADNEAGAGALTITTAGGSKIEAALHGIVAENQGMGALSITANGAVMSSDQDGIHTVNSGAGLNVTTGKGSNVTGLNYGIYAQNYGSGKLNVIANGKVTGTDAAGIFAENVNGNGLRITTGANSRVMGGECGIIANNNAGALNIKAGGDVIGTTCAGIEAMSGGTTAKITTGKGSTVRGRYYGINLLHAGTGAINIKVNGDVVAPNGSAIVAAHLASGGTINITVGPNGHVRSGGNNPLIDFGIVAVGGRGDIVVAGKVDGGAAGAILFDQCDCLDNQLELRPGFEIDGKVFAGPGPNDALVLGGKGNGAFNLNRIDTGAGTKQYQNFENFEVKSGDWTFSGATTQAFTVNGGVVMGNGTFGGLTFNGGTLAPGNSFGTITVNGAFTLGGGAVYEVEVNANGKSDKVIVNGTVNLTGSVLRVLAENGNYKPSTDYTIIDNDGNDKVKGKFAQVTDNLAFLTPSVLYAGGDGNDVVLTLERTGPGGNPSFCDVAVTKNQCNVGLAFDQFPTTNALFLAVVTQTVEGARQAFDALSGEIHATLSGVLADDSRYVREAILGRLMQANASGGDMQVASLAAAGPQVASLDANAMTLGYGGKDLAPAPYGSPLAFWTRAYGAWGDFDGNRNAATADRDLGGFVSGMDAQLSGSWRAGLATGASFSNIDVSDRTSSADVESFLLAGYLGGMAGPVALRGGGAFAWNDIDTSRAVIFPGFFERQNASYDADTGQIFGEVAYPVSAGGVALEPFAGLAYVSIDGENFREHGGALASLRGSADQDVGYSTLGLRAATTMNWGSTLVVPHVSVAWQHAFDDVTPGAALAFASTGIGFAIEGVPLAEDSALIDAGLDFALGERTTAGLSYSGQFGDGVTDNAVKGRFTWLF
ncbi:MAG: autotransporter domain-containing protein [Methyloceanibacter sp.]|uniref:autotransporter domain-containing protein n=1 Tax=Methyloceanibacter sp. TaxID=1965321 RepID=UPI003D6CFD2A